MLNQRCVPKFVQIHSIGTILYGLAKTGEIWFLDTDRLETGEHAPGWTRLQLDTDIHAFEKAEILEEISTITSAKKRPKTIDSLAEFCDDETMVFLKYNKAKIVGKDIVFPSKVEMNGRVHATIGDALKSLDLGTIIAPEGSKIEDPAWEPTDALQNASRALDKIRKEQEQQIRTMMQS